MTRPITLLLVAAGLMAGALVSWTLAATTRTRLAAEQRRLTLQEQSDYWSGRYDTGAEDPGDDAESLVTAANAAFRQAIRESGGAPPVERLDQVLQAYASALRNGGFSHEAVYNFEYVARLRDTAAKAARRPRTAASSPAAALPDDLPAGPTIHGHPGRHPVDARGNEFEVITPMDYGEREAQPEPTPGKPLRRKG